ncbi:AAA family ATPase [Novosphingobium sp. NDB2Meth1]|uniref:AAA family ATPase n=1 Tax=Novosphingobium sp. NDB2Meth1 TaxID=1892847 RepID=UPI0015C52911|nr:AAA family ATPase [Novosphingobium sp. NDB2Meth1]
MTVDPDAPDGLLVHSFNGGDPLAVKDELRRQGLLPERQERQGMPKPQWRETGCYEYDNGRGDVVYRTKRLEATGHAKRFVAERFEGGRWVNGLGDQPRVLYRLSDLHAAIEAGGDNLVVYFVEGERKADKLALMGFVATAIAFGANGWRDEYAKPLTGLSVVILPDNDGPGRKFAETVKAAVEDVGGNACILDLPGLPPKGDIMDWKGTADDLRTLTAKALRGSLLPMPTLDLAALSMVSPKPKAFAVERLAPLAEVTLFTGPGSAGKSLFGQQLATCAAAGLPCLGLDVRPGAALYLTCEDDPDQLHWRQASICKALRSDMASLAGKLHLISLRGALDNELATFEADGTLKPAAAFHRLVAMIRAAGVKLTILDNVAHLFTGNENDRGEVTRFVNLLNRLAGETGAAILLLGHPNKSGDDYSGSTAWLNAVRSQVTLTHDLETDVRTITVGKANYARKGEAIRFVWMEGAFVREDDLTPDVRRELAEVSRANGEDEAFLACLRARALQGVDRAVGPSRGPNYAPVQFEGMAEAKGYKRQALKRAMDRLYASVRVRTEVVERPGKSGQKSIIVEVM